MKLLFRGARRYLRGRLERADLLLEKGALRALTPGERVFEDAVVFQAGDLVAIPGLVDVHVHLREPGFSYKETVQTGTLAAAHGGFTHVLAMPNLNPVPDRLANLERELEAIEAGARVRVTPYGAISVGQRGRELADLAGMAPFVAGFSDDGRGVQSAELMRAAMREARRLDRVIAAHCEDERLVGGGCVHEGAYARAHGLRGIPSQSEFLQVERDLALAEETGCKYHVCHVSTRQSVALIRAAKARGVDVTCETAPHYLILDQDMLRDEGRFKMNPPLRAREDRLALVEALGEGVIDMVATDHAPHSAEEKSRGLAGSLMGVVGLETAFPALYTALVRTGLLKLETLLARMHDAPVARFGLPEGDDWTLFDVSKSYRVDPEAFLSKGRATPFAGMELFGECLLTVVGGKIAWLNPAIASSF